MCVHRSHAQSEWSPFIERVMRALDLEGIDGIHEEATAAPVFLVASLVDSGLYFARPSEVEYPAVIFSPISRDTPFDPLTSIPSPPPPPFGVSCAAPACTWAKLSPQTKVRLPYHPHRISTGFEGFCCGDDKRRGSSEAECREHFVCRTMH